MPQAPTCGGCALQAGELGQQVEALLRAVNATNDFEAELATRFCTEPPEVRQLALRYAQDAALYRARQI